MTKCAVGHQSLNLRLEAGLFANVKVLMQNLGKQQIARNKTDPSKVSVTPQLLFFKVDQVNTSAGSQEGKIELTHTSKVFRPVLVAPAPASRGPSDSGPARPSAAFPL